MAPTTWPSDEKPQKKHGVVYKTIKFLTFCLVGLFILTWILSSQAVFSRGAFGQAIGRLPVISQFRIILGDEDNLAGAKDDRINFLLMGIGGAGHDGALLTDTVILGSLKLSTREAALVSIPRDLLVKIPDNGFQRINNASAYGDVNDYPDGGAALAAKTVADAFGVSVHYWLRIDFAGFRKVIDDLGGVDVVIDSDFVDEQYPTDDYKVQTISFTKGKEHMAGERALQFARSRHGNNGEGSDFARSKRQQKIIAAVKDKLWSWKIFLNPNKAYRIFEAAQDNIQTNVAAWEIPQLINLAEGIDFKNIKNYVLDDAPGGLLKSATTDEGAYVLVPKSGDYQDLQYFAQNIFTMKEIAEKNIRVIVANGTAVDGLATYLTASAETMGFKVERIANSANKNFEKTVIYDLSDGSEEEALKFLKNKFQAHTSKELPEFLVPLTYRQKENGETEKIEASFIIVAGYDRQDDIRAINEWRAKQEAMSQATSTNQINNN